MKTTNFLKTAVSAVLIFSVSMFVSCKKDEPKKSTPAQQTNTQKLTGKNFLMTAFTAEVPGMGTTDVYATMSACDKDDLTKFNTDGTVTYDEGATKCDASEPQTTSGTWSWASNETVINVTQDGETLAMTVITNDGTNLKLKGSQVENGMTITYEITFKKQ